MRKVVIIGLGTIARYHVTALRSLADWAIVGCCDIREEASADPLYAGMTFDTDVSRLLDAVRPDMAVIATPPDSHRAIMEVCLAHGVHGLVEKPLAATEEDFGWFLQPDIAAHYTAIYHSICGVEVQWWQAHKPESAIRRITMLFSDPYADENGHIAIDKRALGGSWLDSSINALALVSLWVEPEKLRDCRIEHKTDDTCGLPYRTDFSAHTDDCEVSISIRWDEGRNHKETRLETDGKEYVLDHSAQAVFCGGVLLFQNQSSDRLTAQYRAFYEQYPKLTIANGRLYKKCD